MRAISLQCKSIHHLREEIAEVLKSGFDLTLAISFSSISHDLRALAAIFDDAGIDLVGCSTAGEIVDDSLYEESIAVLLLDLKKVHYRIMASSFELSEVYAKAFEIGTFAKTVFDNPGIIIMSGSIMADALRLIAGIKDGVGKEIPLYGGLAGDDLTMYTTYSFSNRFVSGSGMVALVVDADKISMQGLATSGWQPLGGVNTITEAEGNIVRSINGEPALEVFIRHFRLDMKPETKKEQLMHVQTNYPLQLIKNGLDSVLRSPLVIDEVNQSIILAAGVQNGDRFRFSNSPGFEVIEQTVEEFGHLKTKVPEADAMILFSCKGRHGAFGPVLEEEIAGIHAYWKKPMIGFLSYGEFGNTKNGICEFHNETCSLVVLKEI